MQNPSKGQFIPLGLYPHGDFGPWTFYTSRRRKVIRFPRAPPTKPPTYLQRRQRRTFTAIATCWMAATEPQRQWWRDLAQLNRVAITPYNLFVAYWSKPDKRWLATLRQP
jgi:hypothetical protein